jgi:hypothetical protein
LFNISHMAIMVGIVIINSIVVVVLLMTIMETIMMMMAIHFDLENLIIVN